MIVLMMEETEMPETTDVVTDDLDDLDEMRIVMTAVKTAAADVMIKMREMTAADVMTAMTEMIAADVMTAMREMTAADAMTVTTEEISVMKQGQNAETIPQSPVIFVLTAVKRADVLAAKTVKIQKKHKQIYDIIKAETM